MDIYEIKEKIEKEFTGKLLSHSKGVEDMARRLSAAYGADEEKAALAALLHDYGKIYPTHDLMQVAVENNIVDEFSLQEPALLHAPVGSWLLEHELGIYDLEILNAVKTHTTGSAGMPLLSCIIYLADFIEPGRSFPGVVEIRELSFRDLHKALLGAVDSTIRYVMERHGILHPSSILFRNWLISLLRKKSGSCSVK
ncbi:MAG: HD domain-containing protein [Firmicutes bacterium]|nr:HD domain-containing protein [Bacillota bacterium]